MKNRDKKDNNLLFLILVFFFLPLRYLLPWDVGWAKEEEVQKSAAPQQVGGLLFDMDEGVKIRQGPGGSVYIESNREYMQRKFSEIDEKFEDLDARLKALEEKAAETDEDKEPGEEESKEPPAGRRVLTS